MMKRFMQFLQLHPLVAIVYTMYIISWATVLKVTIRQSGIDGTEKLLYGEALIWTYLFMQLASAIYLLITVFQAVFIRNQRLFYLRLAMLIVLPASVISIWGYL